MKTHCDECGILCCSDGCKTDHKCFSCESADCKKTIKLSDFPTECCSYIWGKCCDKPAEHFYFHNKNICSYCEEHNYSCGELLLKENFK